MPDDIVIPEFMPIPISGAGQSPETGGCLMQIASWFFDGGWDDRPECVWTPLQSFGITVNDAINSADVRRRLMLEVPRLLSTAGAMAAAGDEDAHLAVLRWAAQSAHDRVQAGQNGEQPCNACVVIDSLHDCCSCPRADELSDSTIRHISCGKYEGNLTDEDLVAWFHDLLDRFDEVTGTVLDESVVTEKEWRALASAQHRTLPAAAV